MLINQAFAQETAPAAATGTSAVVADAAAGATAANANDVMLWNVGFIAVMVVLFYLLLIRPQQSRFREHNDMLKALHKGDKIVLQSGMVAVIEKIDNDSQEVIVNLSEGHKVTVLRSAIAGKYADIVKTK